MKRFIFVLLIVMILPSVLAEWCYQHNITDTTCGNGIGTWEADSDWVNPLYALDNDINSFGEAYDPPSGNFLDITIERPNDVVNAIIEVRLNKTGTSSPYYQNFSVSDVCLNRTDDDLIFRYQSAINNNNYVNCLTYLGFNDNLGYIGTYAGYFDTGIWWEIDNGLGTINIDYPTNNTYSSNVTSATITTTNTTEVSCVYSLNGATNISFNCETISSLSTIEGSNHLIVFSNESDSYRTDEVYYTYDYEEVEAGDLAVNLTFSEGTEYFIQYSNQTDLGSGNSVIINPSFSGEEIVAYFNNQSDILNDTWAQFYHFYADVPKNVSLYVMPTPELEYHLSTRDIAGNKLSGTLVEFFAGFEPVTGIELKFIGQKYSNNVGNLYMYIPLNWAMYVNATKDDYTHEFKEIYLRNINNTEFNPDYIYLQKDSTVNLPYKLALSGFHLAGSDYEFSILMCEDCTVSANTDYGVYNSYANISSIAHVSDFSNYDIKVRTVIVPDVYFNDTSYTELYIYLYDNNGDYNGNLTVNINNRMYSTEEANIMDFDDSFKDIRLSKIVFFIGLILVAIMLQFLLRNLTGTIGFHVYYIGIVIGFITGFGYVWASVPVVLYYMSETWRKIADLRD